VKKPFKFIYIQTMSRQTIDFGIDLGTTNSAIAVMDGVEPLIIKNLHGQDITPSAVGFTKAGVLRLGDAAKRLQLGSPKDAYTEFKRRMGSDQVYDFPATGKKLRPEDLSAEVLKTLKGDVEQARGESVQAAVITVPAAFELHQCDATRRAAELAGFSTSPLVQEPVAAALAYGFQKDEEKAYWMVYDFGGGTFDAALIRAEEGIINVVAHEGDNFLGGSDIDWAILQELLLPRLTKEFKLPDFRRGNARWDMAILKLKSAIEKAKIEASRSSRAPLIECSFEDASGDEVDVEALGLELVQQDIARIAEPIISKSIALVKKVLASKNLRPGDLHKAILVGGPTQAPYFRAQLQAELGAPVDYSVDPMTVVARGAAVFASTQMAGKKTVAPVQVGEFNLDLKYKPTGIEPDPLVGGRVLASSPVSFAGYTIEFANDKSGWTSGQAPVHEDGTFTIMLSAERKMRNQYRIILRNNSGQAQKTTPDNLHYTIGAAVEEQPIIHSIGVGLANNSMRPYFSKGQGLPQKKMQKFLTTKTVKPGEADSVIHVPVLEGESELSDRNRIIGFLDIKGTDIHRELPEGQEIEVTLKIDASRQILVEAFIPYLDQDDFKIKLDTGRKAAANSSEILRDRLNKEQKRLESLKDQADEAEDRGANKLLGELDRENATQELRRKLRDSEGDFVAGEQCYKMLLDLACRLDEVEAQIKWPVLVKAVRSLDEELRDMARESGTRQQQDKAEDMHDQAEENIRAKNTDKLKRTQDQMLELFRVLLFERPGFWAGWFRNLEQDEPLMSDPVRAKRLIAHGRQAIAENNLQGLRNACVQLSQLLPREVADEAQRGWNAGII
jgi:molecular chaperone DnaK